MTFRFASTALAVATATPALATPCADEVTTLERRLDSAGAAAVTGIRPPAAPPRPTPTRRWRRLPN